MLSTTSREFHSFRRIGGAQRNRNSIAVGCDALYPPSISGHTGQNPKETLMAAETRKWQCPGCGKVFNVLASNADPVLCPECRPQKPKAIPPPLPPPSPTTLPTCPHCGQSVLDEDECPFCGGCMSAKPSGKKNPKALAIPPAKPTKKAQEAEKAEGKKSSQTRPCKYCGRQVARNAKTCPQCGGSKPYPVSTKETMIEVGGLFVLFFTCCIWFPSGSTPNNQNNNPNEPTNQNNNPNEPTKVDAWVMAQQFVEENLKAPGTAKWGWQIPDDVVTQTGPKTFRVNAWVDSQNTFGAVIRTKFVCELEYRGNGSWRMTRLNFQQ